MWLRLDPQGPGKGNEFVDAVKGGSVPREYIPAVKKGVLETLPNGVLAGFPVVDVKVTLFDGSYHEVDSNENAFKMAGSMALKDGLRQAEPGAARADHGGGSGNAGRFHGQRRGRSVLAARHDPGHGRAGRRRQGDRAEVPLSEMFQYSTTLRSATQGRATYSMEFKHYSEVPKTIAEAIINKLTGKERNSEYGADHGQEQV